MDIEKIFLPLLELKIEQLFEGAVDQLVQEKLMEKYGKSKYLFMMLLGKQEKAALRLELQQEIAATQGESLFVRWPGLRDGYDKIMADHKVMVEEFAQQLEQHKDEICTKLLKGKSFTKIDGISWGDADFHNHGRCVVIVETDAGKFVYRPHNCTVDVRLRELVDRFYAEHVYIPACVDAGQCGFCEFIENTRATTLEETKAFYYNVGAFAALASALNINDVHQDNVLASGAKPVLVDAETAIFPYREYNAYEADNITARAEFSNTIGRSLLFNTAAFNDGRRLGLCYAETEADLFAPVVEGKVQKGVWYREDILQGFKEGFEKLLAHKEELADCVAKWNCEVRVFIKSTSSYAEALKMLHSAKALEEPDFRQKVLDALGLRNDKSGIVGLDAILEAEQQSVLGEYIPRFYTYANSCDLYWEGRLIKQGYYVKSAVDNTLNKLQQLSTAHITFGMEIIKRIFSLYIEKTEPEPKVKDELTTAITEEEAWLRAQQLIEELDALGIKTPAGNTLYLVLAYAKPDIKPMDCGLGFGTLGIGCVGAAFLAVAAKRGTSQELLAKATHLVDQSLQALELNCQELEQEKQLSSINVPAGFSSGMGGVLLGLNYMEQLLQNGRAAALRDRLLTQLERMAIEDDTASLYNSATGLLVGLGSCPKTPQTIELTKRCGEHLLALQSYSYKNRRVWQTLRGKRAISGYGNGMAGVGMAFLQAYKMVGEARYLTAAKAALEFELEVYSDKLQTWPDFRGLSNPDNFMHGICSGAPGISFFLQEAEGLGLEGASDGLEKARLALDKDIFLYRDNLCCGNTSVIEALLTLGEKEKASRLLGKMERRAARRGCFENNSPGVKCTIEPDLLFGYAGIAYTYLRYLEPKLVPSLFV